VFAWIRVEGRTHLADLHGPVIFASNHQSYMDTPVIMAALPRRWRYRLAPAMAKEFFAAHFAPEGQRPIVRVATSVAYYLAALVFNAFPLPQREAGARQTLRYMGELVENGFSVLIFPEGHHTDTGEIDRLRAPSHVAHGPAGTCTRGVRGADAPHGHGLRGARHTGGSGSPRLGWRIAQIDGWRITVAQNGAVTVTGNVQCWTRRGETCAALAASGRARGHRSSEVVP
jgi:hypothetical protein